ncbi:alpha/beta fold hydrolase [Sciscionella marina]|uniref:alpha/beta fold hydrolase n=1 Tax=Sciscionella marina TaxID=508770 RepID=UPI000361E721|nr:alpha/beta hydrolase [Sciscionella marina]
MTYIQVDTSVRLFAQDIGEGPALVLIAGFGLDHRVWDRQVTMLARDHRVICVDQRGHGYSDKPLGGYEVDRLAYDLHLVLDKLGVERCDLLGWSFGGQVAFRAAAEEPERVNSLVLVGSNGVRASRSTEFPFGRSAADVEPALVTAEERNRLAARRTALAGAFQRDAEPELLEWLVGCSLSMPSWAGAACYHTMLNADLIADLPRVTMPVLQLIGRQDPVHSAKGARWVNERLPDSRLVELDDCGHYPMFEAADRFDEALLEFLAAP